MKIRCKRCGDIIESKSRHDLVYCKCERIAIDGGTDYSRILTRGELQEGIDYEVIK